MQCITLRLSRTRLLDPLTGLPNPRYMALRFEQEVSRARRTGRPFQVVMLDLDDFKSVNDTFGHKVGDKMLREVAHLIQEQLREYDFMARYAGDEFVAIVQEVGDAQVEDLRYRIENAVAHFSMHVRGDKYARVGISVGMATFELDGETLDQLLIVADQAMYRVKSEHKHGSVHDNAKSASRLSNPPVVSNTPVLSSGSVLANASGRSSARRPFKHFWSFEHCWFFYHDSCRPHQYSCGRRACLYLSELTIGNPRGVACIYWRNPASGIVDYHDTRTLLYECSG